MCFTENEREGTGDEPNSPEDQTRRAPREAVCPSQDGADAQVLLAVRQDLSEGCPGGGVQEVEVEARRRGSRWTDVRDDRGVRRGALATGVAEAVAGEDLSAPSSQEGADSQTRRRRAALGNPDDHGSGSTGGGEPHSGTHLRSGPERRGLWVSTPAKPRSSRGEGPAVTEGRPDGGCGRGSGEVLRHHPARGADEMSGEADWGWGGAASDPDVAEGAG